MELDKILDTLKKNGNLKEFAKTLTDEQYFELIMPAQAQIVRENPVSVQGFCAYYRAKFKRDVPPIVEFVWAPRYIRAYEKHAGVLVEGHRGSGKSTFLMAWVEYLTGKRPVGSSQLIRINSTQANEADEFISSSIEHSSAWKMCFPNVVPDRSKGWAQSGRFVKDLDVCGENDENYPKWIEMCQKDHLVEPSFMCSGITTRDFIGKHPSNGQYYDDLHDESNTRSAAEMREIVDIIEKNIVPTWTRPENRPVLGVACTLWNPNDGYHALLRTGLFEHIKTPIYVTEENPSIQVGEDRVIPHWIKKYGVHEFEGKRIIPMWDAYGIETIKQLKRQNPVYFDLMFMCDMESIKGKVLKAEWLHTFPMEKLPANVPVYFGVDFATVEDKLKDKKRDFFALAVVAALPWGGGVVIDGFREHLTFHEAINRVKAFADKYPTLVTVGVEKWGSGEKFKEALLYSSGLSVIPWPMEGAPVRSKGQRYQMELAPMFVDGRLWVSDNPVEFIKQFREEWITWDGGKTATGHDDCMDAVYVAAGVAQGHLMPLPVSPSLRFENQNKTGLRSAWSSIGDIK